MNFENLLQRIMDSDINIRHSIITYTEGNILATSHREGIMNYLSPKIGNGLYAVAAFEKITRMTFPLGNENLIFVNMGSDSVRTDMHAGGQHQIVQHVLNILSRDPTKE